MRRAARGKGRGGSSAGAPAAPGMRRPQQARPQAPAKRARDASDEDEGDSSDEDEDPATRRAHRRAGSPPRAGESAPAGDHPATPFQRLLAADAKASRGDNNDPASLVTGKDDAAAAAEAALQRRLARKLGLKKVKSRAAADAAAPLSAAARELEAAWTAAGFGGSDAEEGGGDMAEAGSESNEEGEDDDDGCTTATESEEEEGEGEGGGGGGRRAATTRSLSPSSEGEGTPSGDSLSDPLPGGGTSGEEDEGDSGLSLSSDGEGGEEEGGRLSSSDDDGVDHPSPAGHPAPASARYVPPALRRAMAAAIGAGHAHAPSPLDAADAAAQRAVTGALNRLADGTLPSVGPAIAALVRGEGGGRPARARAAVVGELVKAAEAGPRATPAFAAAAAGLVVGVAGAARSPALAAEAAAATAAALERAVAAADSTAAANLTGLACALYAAGGMGSAALFGLLSRRLAAFTEADVAVAAATLRASGPRLRSEDPAAMKCIVLAASSKAAAARAAGTLTPRADALLGLVLDVKNNRGGGRGGAGGAATPAAALSAGASRWVRDAGGGDVSASLACVEWDTLVAPEAARRGAWWQAGPPPGSGLGRSAGTAGTDPLGLLAPPTPAAAAAAAAADDDAHNASTTPDSLIRLAATHGMTSAPRRAAFCVVMGSADAADAAERLLRLALPGPAGRETVRVPLECALAEPAWNPYYPLLLTRLANGSGRAGRATLRLAVRDALRGAADGAEAWPPRKAATLARLVGFLLAQKGVLPLAAVVPAPAELSTYGAPIPARRRLLWRAVVRAALAAGSDRAAAVGPFERLASAAAHSEAAAFGGGGGGDEDEYVLAMAAAAGGKMARPDEAEGGDGKEGGQRGGRGGGGATPAACAALQAFVRAHVVPWLPTAGPAPGGSGGPGSAAVGVDELTLRARDAERALGRGAKSGGGGGGGRVF